MQKMNSVDEESMFDENLECDEQLPPEDIADYAFQEHEGSQNDQQTEEDEEAEAQSVDEVARIPHHETLTYLCSLETYMQQQGLILRKVMPQRW